MEPSHETFVLPAGKQLRNQGLDNRLERYSRCSMTRAYLAEATGSLCGSFALPLETLGDKRATCEPSQPAPWSDVLQKTVGTKLIVVDHPYLGEGIQADYSSLIIKLQVARG